MAVDTHKLIAAISPDLYSTNKDEIKKIIKDEFKKYNDSVNSFIKSGVKKEDALLMVTNNAYSEAAKKASVKDSEVMNYEKAFYQNLMSYKTALKNPIEKHKLSYDAPGESLEPIYFWFLDTLNNFGFTGTEKLIDNFGSTVGSGHFSEMGMKMSRMQEEAMKMLGAVNQVIKSVLNIIYDLKEFKIRLDVYDQLKDKEQAKKDAARISLKQIWLDTVDAKRGNSSIKAMALTQANFVTLIDAFFAVEDEKLKIKGSDDEIDLNDRVKRILQQRILEFNLWVRESEMELRKRFEIEKTYLKSQYNTIQMYSRWIQPYLKAAKALEQNTQNKVDMVNMFNTTILEVALLAKGSSYNPNDDVYGGLLPKMFKDAHKNKDYKKFVPAILVELRFRSIPEKQGQNYGFRGRLDLTMTSYCLTDQEIETLKQETEKDNFKDMLQWIEGSTQQSLGNLKDDIDFFLYNKSREKPEDKDKPKEKESGDVNPFSELFSFFWEDEKKDKKSEFLVSPPSSDNDAEKVLRGLAIVDVRKRCAKIYEIYKKSNKMPAFGSTDDAF